MYINRYIHVHGYVSVFFERNLLKAHIVLVRSIISYYLFRSESNMVAFYRNEDFIPWKPLFSFSFKLIYRRIIVFIRHYNRINFPCPEIPFHDIAMNLIKILSRRNNISYIILYPAFYPASLNHICCYVYFFSSVVHF